jgi:ABC-type transport system involved in multi-copper enzyme maturation permease subunit
MPSLVDPQPAPPAALRWPGSFRSWGEGLLLVLLAGVAVAVCWYGSLLSAPWQLAFGVALLVTLGCAVRWNWLKLFGPLLFYDMLRNGRRGAFRRIRLYYVIVLALWFTLLFLGHFIDYTQDLEELLFSSFSLRPAEASKVATQFLACFLAFQFGAALLLTPAYVSGAVVEEKERQTLPFLLTTDLRNREIILGMLISRVLNLLMVLLAGLPVLLLIQFLGGIDPELLLAGFAATGLTIASLAGLSMLISVYARRPFQAIATTYLVALGYLGVSGLLTWAVVEVPGFAGFPSTLDWTSPVTAADVAGWLSAGNPGVGLWWLAEADSRGPGLDTVLPDLLQSYAWFHGIVFLTSTAWAVARVRAVARRQWSGPTHRAARALERETVPVGRWAMIWKEVTLEGRLRGGWLVRAGGGLLIAASLLPAAGIVGWFIYVALGADWSGLSEAMFDWARVAGTVVACLLLLQVALRAAGSLTGERSKQTLDALLTTPLDSNAILFGKWLGSVLRPRRGFLLLGSIWAIAYLTGGLNPWTVPILVLAWLMFADFFAGLGLWFSVTSRSTLHATVGTILAIVILTVGHWLVALFYVGLARWLFDLNLDRFAENFHAFALTPPLTLGALTLPPGDRLFEGNLRHLDALLMAIFGVGLYGVGGWCLWVGARPRFRRLSNRTARQRPERAPIPELPVPSPLVGKG